LAREVASVVGALLAIVALRRFPIGIEWIVRAFGGEDRLAKAVQALPIAVARRAVRQGGIVVADPIRRDANARARVRVRVATVPVDAEIGNTNPLAAKSEPARTGGAVVERSVPAGQLASVGRALVSIVTRLIVAFVAELQEWKTARGFSPAVALAGLAIETRFARVPRRINADIIDAVVVGARVPIVAHDTITVV
jgi:hypothetical protein